MAKELGYRDDPSASSSTATYLASPPTYNSAPPDYEELSSRTVTVRKSVLCPDATFIIQHRDTGRIVTLVDGELRLCEGYSSRGGFHWQCVTKDRWLGFRNAVSGTYIGHNDKKKFIANVRHHQSNEHFLERLNQKGSYEVLVKHGNDLRSMAIGSDGTSLVETKDEGDLWDFIKV
ncbi:hypothetical protein jhhlp_000666 [Lomentospora prolificans]|uniref:Ricin B lectin domain-containing protein n=1 Tax=Lomentospora prolificans TaxID=41688 RepID=A0A2N3NJ49_9PEZI|nr:hypothetical protein jhhlp_000666 [Lomentospora prolificans]